MEEKLNEKVEESSLERLKRVAEELNKIGVNPVKGQRGVVEAQKEQTSNGVKESRKENLIENLEGKLSASYGAGEKTLNPVPQKGEMKIAETSLSDLIQEKMKLEKILQEMNNLKSKICQRIGIIKTIERREKELNQQLASAGKENDFPDQIKESFENLKENIKF